MRSENLSRLSDIKITKSSAYYLHYKSFHSALFSSLAKFAKGRLLDIGCGNKPYEGILKGKISEYIGCDIIQSNLNKVDILSLHCSILFMASRKYSP